MRILLSLCLRDSTPKAQHAPVTLKGDYTLGEQLNFVINRNGCKLKMWLTLHDFKSLDLDVHRY